MIGHQTVLYGMVTPPRQRPSRTSGRLPKSPIRLTGRIIIAEDDYFVGMTIEQMLLDAGHDILAVVATGEEAVRQGARLRPDLVLMDIRLAGQMTGIEAAVELRAQGIISLFATAHSDAATRASGEKAKPAGWLTKPFSSSEVLSAVAAALAQNKRH